MLKVQADMEKLGCDKVPFLDKAQVLVNEQNLSRTVPVTWIFRTHDQDLGIGHLTDLDLVAEG